MIFSKKLALNNSFKKKNSNCLYYCDGLLCEFSSGCEDKCLGVGG